MTEGHDSARIVLVGRRPGAGGGPQVGDGERPRSGWTVRRLINAASLGGVATVAGGLVFQRNFQLFGDNNPLLLAMGFGLFVVGMIVLTLCLIGLAAAAVRALVATRGWGAAVLAGLAASAPLLLLGFVGVVSFAFPALFVLMVTGGFVLALKR
ncbi:MAG TPA: hypothetical protein VGC59_05095 [Solirubrobacteraceae bacterium]|jgi:hypothetical protein